MGGERLPIRGALDDDYLNHGFINKVQQRGQAIIQQRGLSSATSAAQAVIQHMRDWILGTDGRYVSMVVNSDGNPYGEDVPDGLMFSFPCICEDGKWTIADGLVIDKFSKGLIKASGDELLEEKEAVIAVVDSMVK
eukprot:NODE_1525_length_584_cov_1217.041121_g1224_i0.p1 GENE.NODE_1525_length_584_cov_1217.041121_g1224_i0~~NODE_1525_length_584_cov_1217.041121_g1224_i0.p1  ORF type:complete len:144 (+),score=37.76 NODE_1525_length_584_cov_1217.041121_g1224_i0:25-432(+)